MFLANPPRNRRLLPNTVVSTEVERPREYFRCDADSGNSTQKLSLLVGVHLRLTQREGTQSGTQMSTSVPDFSLLSICVRTSTAPETPPYCIWIFRNLETTS